MPTRSERSKKKKFRRAISGKVKIDYIRGKAGKHKCAVCKGVLHGVAHGKIRSEVAKLSKSKKKPNTAFAGVLCGKCRNIVFEEAIKVNAEAKEMVDVSLTIKGYVESALKRIG